MTMVSREIEAAKAEGREPSAEVLAVLARWETELQEDDEE
jgi:hypothetical protein